MKLMIQYLYEGEYDPRLPEEPFMTKTGTWNFKIASDKKKFRYDFPHTCSPGCPSPGDNVCPHHHCLSNTCREECVRFICRTCTAPQPPTGGAPQLLIHSKLFAMAEKYDIPGLALLAQAKFARACESNSDTDDFITATEHVLTSTPDSKEGLRKILHEVLALKRTLMKNSEIAALLNKHVGFAFGVLKRQAEEMDKMEALLAAQQIGTLKERREPVKRRIHDTTVCTTQTNDWN
jgi:hypothetical protein